MNNQVIKNAYDNYVDATVELFVACYSEACAKRMREEMAACSEENTDFPAALDTRCRTLIKKEETLRRRKQLCKAAMRIAKSAAIIVLAMLSLSSILFVTVEAIRIPIINFYIEQNKDYWKITAQGSEHKGATIANVDLTDPLADIVPEGYVVTFVKGDALKQLTAIYENQHRNSIFFSTQPYIGTAALDSENAQVSQKFIILGHDAIIVTKDGDVSISWINQATGIVYTLTADQFDQGDALRIAEKIAEKMS